MNKIILILIFLFIIEFGFCEKIKLPEEKITGESQKIEKTEIFIFPFSPVEIKFPEIKILKIGKKKEKTKAKKEKLMENYVVFSGGSFTTFTAKIFKKLKLENVYLTFNSETFFTSGYRKNNGKRREGVLFNIEGEKHSFLFDFANGVYELPGPYFSPFDAERKWIKFRTRYIFSKEGFFAEINPSFYKIDDMKTFYLNSLIGYKINSISFLTDFTYQEFKDVFSINSFSEKLLWEKDRFKIGGEIKKIENYGERFLPYFEFSPYEKLSFKLEGIYKIPDLWNEVQISDYKEIERKNLPPEEKYNFEVSIAKKNRKSQFKTVFSTSYFKTYTWKDTDGNFMLQPYREKFYENSLNFYFSYKFPRNTEIFFYGNKVIRSKDINYYPKETINGGVKFDFFPFNLKIWTEYTGERKFGNEKIGGVSLFNSRIGYKKRNFEVIAAVYNLTGKEYFVIPGYPGEERKFILSVKIYF